MPPPLSAAGVERKLVGGEDPLPGEGIGLDRVFTFECVGKLDVAVARFEITLVLSPDAFNLKLQFIPA